MQEETIVNVDPTRLQQVIINLISNAIKFSPSDGKIDVFFSQSSSEYENHFGLTVRDYGIGISPEE